MDISNSAIIITGAASGFGKAMSIAFAEQGALVYALDIQKDLLEQLQLACNSIQIFECDITDVTAVDNVFETVFETIQKPVVLINNAGIMKNSPLYNMLQRPDGKHDIDLWHKVISVNQHAVFYTSRIFAAFAIKKRLQGTIINISSISARGNIGQTAYAASKAAVEAMTKVWAKELGAFGIRAVAIAPGFIDTAGTHDALEEKMLAQWIQKTPLRRTGLVQEIVHAVTFAIENNFVTGEVIHVNGGLVI